MSSESQKSICRSLNTICDQFEDAWIAGEIPEISDFLDDQHDVEFCRALFSQLLELDVFYREKRGIASVPDQVKSQFPDFSKIIDEKFSEKKEKGRHHNSSISSKTVASNFETQNSLFQELLERATGGDESALGTLLDQHRSYLRLIAQRDIGLKLKTRVDPSDVVQKSCLAAIAGFPGFAGKTMPKFIGWLTELHRNKIKDEYKMALAAKRNMNQEADLPDEMADGSAPSPHQRILDGEKAVLLAQAMEQLQERQREVVRLRHLEGWTIRQLSEHFDSNPQAITALIYRGITRLRQIMRDQKDSISGKSSS